MGKFVKTTEAGKRSGTGKLPRLVFFCDFIFTVERNADEVGVMTRTDTHNSKSLLKIIW